MNRNCVLRAQSSCRVPETSELLVSSCPGTRPVCNVLAKPTTREAAQWRPHLLRASISRHARPSQQFVQVEPSHRVAKLLPLTEEQREECEGQRAGICIPHCPATTRMSKRHNEQSGSRSRAMLGRGRLRSATMMLKATISMTKTASSPFCQNGITETSSGNLPHFQVSADTKR